LKQGSWPSIALIYLYGVLGSASLSKVIPLQQDFATHLGASPAQFALLISLLTVAPAFFAAVGGSVIDRVGARRTPTSTPPTCTPSRSSGCSRAA
jgi:MFS family permease